MKRKHLETIPEMAMRQVGYDILKKILVGLGVLAVVALVAIWLTGCATVTATAPVVRTATTEEAAQYGLKAGAHRYEYPDAVVFTATESTGHPEVVHDGRPLSISLDASQTADMSINSTNELVENGVARATETIKACVPGTDRCSVMVRETIMIMRSEPINVVVPSSDVLTSVKVMGREVVMLQPTETALRALVLRAVQLREDPPQPGGDCKRSRLTDDFVGEVHAPFERRAVDLLAEDEYVPIHAVLEAEHVLARYELAERKCLVAGDQVEASFRGARLIAEILGTVYVDPNL